MNEGEEECAPLDEPNAAMDSNVGAAEGGAEGGSTTAGIVTLPSPGEPLIGTGVLSHLAVLMCVKKRACSTSQTAARISAG